MQSIIELDLPESLANINYGNTVRDDPWVRWGMWNY